MVELKDLDYSHIAIYKKLFEPNLWPYLQVACWEDEEAYLELCLTRKERGIPTFFYLIYAPKENAYVGAIQIRLPDENPGQLYCWINKQYWGKGYLQEAIKKTATIYFNETGLTEFTARVYCENPRSYKALLKAGFEPVGIGSGLYGNQWILIFKKSNL